MREDLGEPPLVTPSSQIVGTQAVLNVLTGERYKVMSQETKRILHGDYGRTVKPFNREIQKKPLARRCRLPAGQPICLRQSLETLAKSSGGF